jgi:branched-chain amino acid transport system substrate-binding protein
MDDAGVSSTRSRRAPRCVVVLSALVVAATLTACSSTNTAANDASASTSTKASIPPAAFSDHTGITADSVSIGNVSTLYAGLFKGAAVGTEAYADYVNSTGGINGRKLHVDSYDDNFTGAANKAQTQAAIQKDFALVGGFSLFDNFGGTLLKANPQVPNVTVSLDLATANLPNSFSPAPAVNGWPTGALKYFAQKYPTQIQHAGALIADEPSATSKWNAEHAAMNSLGYKVVYDPTFDITTTNFDQYVINMKNAGVKILFMEQMPENYAAAVVKALDDQNFHPILVFGGSTYSEKLVSDSGGASAVDGAYLTQNTSLFLGEDSPAIPAVGTFLSWVQKASPGFSPDLYTLFGWLSAELFTQALRSAGSDPSRGSLLQSLSKIDSFSGGYLVGTANPAKKIPTACYIMAKFVDGKLQRLDDPPVTGSSHGYVCGDAYFYVKS